MLRDPKIAAGAIGGTLVAIGAAVFLWMRSRKPRVKAETAPAIASAEGAALTASLDQQIQARLAEQAELEHRMEQEALSSIKMPKVTTKKAEVLLKQVREQGKKDASIGAHVLRAWIGDVPQRKGY